jgi:hypothetical protein
VLVSSNDFFFFFLEKYTSKTTLLFYLPPLIGVSTISRFTSWAPIIIVSTYETGIAYIGGTIGARIALSASKNHWSHANRVADLDLGDILSYSSDNTGEFMSNNRWKFRGKPVLIECMDIRATNTAISDLEFNIVFFPSF